MGSEDARRLAKELEDLTILEDTDRKSTAKEDATAFGQNKIASVRGPTGTPAPGSSRYNLRSKQNKASPTKDNGMHPPALQVRFRGTATGIINSLCLCSRIRH